MSLINDALKRAKSASKTKISAGGPELQPADHNKQPRKGMSFRTLTKLVALGSVIFVVWWRFGSPAPINDATGGTNSAIRNVLEAGKKNTSRPAANKTASASITHTLTNPFAQVNKLSNAITARAQQEPAPATNAAPTPAASAPPREPVVVAKASPPPDPITTQTVASQPGGTSSKPPTKSSEPSGTVAASSTASQSGGNVTFPELRLQGIYYRLSKPSAMINGKAVFIGDEIGGARVVRIERRTVDLEMRGKTKTLSL